jgi:quinol monooxygenase YgiN
MKVLHAALIAAAALIAVAAPQARAQAPTAQAPAPPSTFAVTYIEVTPAAEAATGDLLRGIAATSRKEAGNLRFDVLQQIERRNQFAILEAWSDAKALETHGGNAAMKQLRAALDPLRTGFYDERLDNGLDVGPAPAAAPKNAIYVVTHVDVTGPFKDDAIVMMKKLVADARREPGAERFDFWQQSNRLNHFTLTEIWKDQAALDAHNAASGTRAFRDQIGRMLGALYDDRRYRNLE